MKVKIKTYDQLVKEGFKRNKDGMYIGELKSRSSMQVTFYQLQHMLGKGYDVTDMAMNGRGEPLYTTSCGHSIPWYLIDGTLPQKSDLGSLLVRKSFGDKEVTICRLSGKISFPCEMKRMDWKTAKSVYAFLSRHFDGGRRR